ncbi:hypothetical protein JCM3766R1_003058, partial [Sporobolomyces carnicolor]
EPKRVEWARSFVTLLEELRKYIMQHHTTGLTWNPKGQDATTWKPSSSSSSPPAAPAPSTGGAAPPAPPPPPPPPPPATDTASTSAAAAGGGGGGAGDMSNVFASLNQGEGITKSLRKVDPSEMTHKNPSLRTGGTVPTTTTTTTTKAAGGGGAGGPQKPPKPSTMVQKKPPKTELEGNKWNIENHENNSSIVLEKTEINHIVNVFNVKSSIIQVKGKVNAVNLVNCPKTSVLIDSCVSALSVSNCPSFTIQIVGVVPTVLVDGCDGGQVYLSNESVSVTEIVSSKCSALNVSVPSSSSSSSDAEAGEFVEKAVPEQFKTVVVDGKLVTTVVEHSA